MNVLVPNLPGGERASETPTTTLAWNDLSASKQEEYLKGFADPNRGVQLEFDAEEAKRLYERGRLNMIQLGGFDDLLGATTKTYVDDDKDVMTNIFGRFKPSAHGIPDGTRVGTVFPHQITSILSEILTPA